MSVADLTDAAAWDERYASTEHPWCCAPAGALTSRVEGLTPGRAIDLGCGVGRHTRFLAESGWDVQAVDFSPVAIEVANTAPDSHHITYTVADARVWTPDEQADLVVVSFLHLPIGPMGSADRTIPEFCRASPIWRGPPGECWSANSAICCAPTQIRRPSTFCFTPSPGTPTAPANGETDARAR